MATINSRVPSPGPQAHPVRSPQVPLQASVRKPQGNGHLLKMSEVTAKYKVSASTIRRHHKDGKLAAVVLPSKHRRFSEAAVREWLGVENEAGKDNGGRLKIAVVARVSSRGQKESLINQRERLTEYVNENFPDADVEWFSEIASGMDFSRSELIRLVLALIDGQFDYLIAQNSDRIARFGYKLIETLAEKSNTKVIYTFDGDDKSLADEFTEDVLAILCHFTARASGEKARKVLRRNLSEDVLQDAFLWRREGSTISEILTRLKREGRNLDSKGKELTRSVLDSRLRENHEMLNALCGSQNSFETFCQEKVRVSDVVSRGVFLETLVARYRQFCEERGETPLSEKQIEDSIPEAWGCTTNEDGRIKYDVVLVKNGGGK